MSSTNSCCRLNSGKIIVKPQAAAGNIMIKMAYLNNTRGLDLIHFCIEIKMYNTMLLHIRAGSK
jgi:hypothetical protein